MANVTFIEQAAPVDEYGRALYAVARSIVRAMLDQLGNDDLTDLNQERADVTLRQLAKLARLDRDKGMKGDGFEWAVHEAIVGGEPLVTTPVSEGLARVSKYIGAGQPRSLLFGHERAKYLGFLTAVVEAAGENAWILPDGRGHPYAFGPWVAIAAEGPSAEPKLSQRIKQVWKTDIFVTDANAEKYVATTIKSNHKLIEEGRGLRMGIVPEAKDLAPGIRRHKNLWLVTLPDPKRALRANPRGNACREDDQSHAVHENTASTSATARSRQSCGERSNRQRSYRSAHSRQRPPFALTGLWSSN